MQTMSLTSTQKMGWIPDIPDHRDLHMTFSTTKEAPKEIKKSLDFKTLKRPSLRGLEDLRGLEVLQQFTLKK